MNKKHPWEVIDPLLFDGETSMKKISRDFHIPYRQVTNRKYAVRNRMEKEEQARKKKSSKRLIRKMNTKRAFLNKVV